ncbi:MAG: hemerythrin domain-containing protein [Chromatiales bacterium]
MRIYEFLTQDHRSCDDHFAKLERAAHEHDWLLARQAMTEFQQATLEHFQLEEALLFPALEDMLGQCNGPTEVMRLEHVEIRLLLDELSLAINRRDGETLYALGDTLVILLQQHNAKEEQILYPIAERLPDEIKTEILEKMQAMAE